MAEVILKMGGKPYTLPPVSFAALEQAWPIIDSFATAKDLVGQAAMVIQILAIVFEESAPELSIDEIKKRLRGREFVELVRQVPDIFEAMGLVKAGEAKPAGESSEQPASGN